MGLPDGVDWLVENMLPPEEDQEIKGTVEGCLYRRIAREISTEQL